MASLRFPFKGEPLTSAEVLNRLPDREEAARREAARSLGKVLGDNARVFSLIPNTLAKDKEIEDRWRQYERPVSSRHHANLVEEEVVAALVASVPSRYRTVEEQR